MSDAAQIISLVHTDPSNSSEICAALHRISTLLSFSQNPWVDLGQADVPELREALCTLITTTTTTALQNTTMTQKPSADVAWLAGNVLGRLMQLVGRDAHRACDQDTAQGLLALLRQTDAQVEPQLVDQVCLGVAAIADAFCTLEEAVDAIARAGLALHTRASLTSMASVASKNANVVMTKCLGICLDESSTAKDLDWCAQVVSVSATSALTLAFCQHASVKASDGSAPIRTQAIRVISLLAPKGMAEFLRVLANSTVVSRRVFACDLAAELLCKKDANIVKATPAPPQATLATSPTGSQTTTSQDILLLVVLARTRDKAALVRQAALRACSEFVPVLDGIPSDFIKSVQDAGSDEKSAVRRGALKVCCCFLEEQWRKTAKLTKKML